MRRFVHVFVLLALALAPLACAAPAPVKYLVPMQDGTKLATDVYTPSEKGKWPVILARSTYGRPAMDAEKLVKQGYACVVQDVRGMGESEGEHFVFHADGWYPGLTDGADTAAWIKEQPWCNGIIGTYGGSALGITQQLIAPTTKLLSAQYVQVAPSNLYEQCAYRGGVWGKNLLESWLTAIKQPHLIEVYKSHPRYDEFWSYFNFDAKTPDIAAPAMFEGGWYDIFNQGEIDSFVNREKIGGPGCKGNNYLIMKLSLIHI